MSENQINENDVQEVEEYPIPHKITLRYPIEIGKETITEIEFKRRLRGSDMKGIPADGMMYDHMYRILGRLIALPAAYVDKMDMADIKEGLKVVESFLSDGRTTGEQ